MKSSINTESKAASDNNDENNDIENNNDDNNTVVENTVSDEPIEKIEETPPHNDPFDKILLAQAKGDGMLLLTHDKCFSYYDEPYYKIV